LLRSCSLYGGVFIASDSKVVVECSSDILYLWKGQEGQTNLKDKGGTEWMTWVAANNSANNILLLLGGENNKATDS
jgi:hypothetical protein